ncbi:MAG: hypothetical protein FD175_1904 [Beijerinckiaceae bacterium]|nr:MAG: hypothetical protein FD175_1904 [Beijerinckiaceae bacterium]
MRQFELAAEIRDECRFILRFGPQTVVDGSDREGRKIGARRRTQPEHGHRIRATGNTQQDAGAIVAAQRATQQRQSLFRCQRKLVDQAAVLVV